GWSTTSTAVLVQPDGHIVLTGSCSNASSTKKCVQRISSDGSADRTFNVDGRSIDFVRVGNNETFAVAQDAQGRLVLGGRCDGGNNTPTGCLTRLEASPKLYRQCSFDLDGDGKLTTRDTLIGARVALGFRGAALFSGINPIGSDPDFFNARALSSYLILECGLGGVE
ncbi:MAG: hypothetical protein ACRCWJ_13470, partial [Casimicrobium sp.]